MFRKILGKKKNINLFFLIPFTFSALSLFWVIMTYGLADRLFKPDSLFSFPLWGGVVAATTFFIGLLITWLILKPVQAFVKKAESLPAFTKRTGEGTSQTDDLEHYARVLSQATSLLSKVEAGELFPNIIGQSRVMRAIFNQVLKVADTDSTVLLLGESGTGKDLIAESIYEHSRRKGKPFLKLNCVAIPSTLLESELFGYEKGAFTGATAQKKGKFELAHPGTIFLDEIGDMPLETQAKLLRVLQSKEFERIGGTATIKVDVRFIAATNKNLPELVKSGQFREDLYHRLNVFSITLPPLRERREDIPLLADYFRLHSPRQVKISPQALQLLLIYDWPGNVRELQNAIERASVLAESGVLEPEHLAQHISTHSLAEKFSLSGREDESIDEQIDRIEKSLVIEALQRSAGNQARASRILGINRRSLIYRISKHNIDVASLKNVQKM